MRPNPRQHPAATLAAERRLDTECRTHPNDVHGEFAQPVVDAICLVAAQRGHDAAKRVVAAYVRTGRRGAVAEARLVLDPTVTPVAPRGLRVRLSGTRRHRARPTRSSTASGDSADDGPGEHGPPHVAEFGPLRGEINGGVDAVTPIVSEQKYDPRHNLRTMDEIHGSVCTAATEAVAK